MALLSLEVSLQPKYAPLSTVPATCDHKHIKALFCPVKDPSALPCASIHMQMYPSGCLPTCNYRGLEWQGGTFWAGLPSDASGDRMGFSMEVISCRERVRPSLFAALAAPSTVLAASCRLSVSSASPLLRSSYSKDRDHQYGASTDRVIIPPCTCAAQSTVRGRPLGPPTVTISNREITTQLLSWHIPYSCGAMQGGED
jgi:hypothetical protein